MILIVDICRWIRMESRVGHQRAEEGSKLLLEMPRNKDHEALKTLALAIKVSISCSRFILIPEHRLSYIFQNRVYVSRSLQILQLLYHHL